MTCPQAKTVSRLLCLAAAACLTGCWVPPPPDEKIGFFLGSRQDLRRTKRVVFVELTPFGTCPPQIAWDMTETLGHALQRRGLFRVDVVRRTDPMCRDLPLDRVEAFSIEDLAQIRKALGCDAVLLGNVSRFQPYPRMQLALYLRMIDLRHGKLLWGVDHTWDSTAVGTERRIRRYFHDEVREGYDPLGWELILKSPRAFEKFVAHEAAGTLPARRRAAKARPQQGAADRPGTSKSGAKKTPPPAPKNLE